MIDYAKKINSIGRYTDIMGFKKDEISQLTSKEVIKNEIQNN